MENIPVVNVKAAIVGRHLDLTVLTDVLILTQLNANILYIYHICSYKYLNLEQPKKRRPKRRFFSIKLSKKHL